MPLPKCALSQQVSYSVGRRQQHPNPFIAMCRSLFEKDKLLFAFLMCAHLKAQISKTLDWAQLRFLLTGGISTTETPPNPSDWLADKLWGEMYRLSEAFEVFNELVRHFTKDQAPYKVG